MNKQTLIILFLITCLSFFLRLFSIDQRPMILNRDEAALAYNGYLLALTGKDEWQKNWPLALESFGDYKLLGYPLLLSLLFQVLPANDLVVKLPSIVAGGFLPLITYFFVVNLFDTKKNKNLIGLLTSFFVATNPIFIFYSRTAFEANLALSLLALSLTLIISSILHPNKKVIDTIKIFFGITVYFLSTITYNTPLLLLPFFIIGFLIFINKQNYQKISFIIFLLVTNFIVIFLILSPLTAQKSSITIFSDSFTRHNYIEYRNFLTAQPSPINNILTSQYIFFGKIIIQNIFNSFDYKFLVDVGGQHPWHNIPNQAHIFAFIYLFSILGILMLLKEILAAIFYKDFSSQNKSKFLILFFCFASLAPSVVTVDAPHATRSLFFIFMLVVIAGFFVNYILDKQKYLLIIIIIATTFSTYNYMNRYLNENETEHKKRYLVGFEKAAKESFEKTRDQQQKTDIAVVDPDGYQYILLAWYLKIMPEDFFNTVIKQLPNRIGFRYGERVLNYHFIADENDRSENEKIMIKWNDKINDWELL